MTHSQPAPTAALRKPGILAAGLLVVIAAVPVALGFQVLASASSTAASPIVVPRKEHAAALGEPDGAAPGDATSPMAASPVVTPRERHDALGEADGAVPDGATVFDDEIPGVANLDSALLGALRRAATNAADDGVAFVVNSGWRSSKYQEQLLREAIPKYGSEREAARWVASPSTSAHVSGDAVDIGPADAAAWLSAHGARYGLCQIYRNEPWHYELRPEAIDQGCPPTYADPTLDPRMQQ